MAASQFRFTPGTVRPTPCYSTSSSSVFSLFDNNPLLLSYVRGFGLLAPPAWRGGRYWDGHALDHLDAGVTGNASLRAFCSEEVFIVCGDP